MSVTINTCVFCGSRPLTREHVLPRWLKRDPTIAKVLQATPHATGQAHALLEVTVDRFRGVSTIGHQERGQKPRMTDIVVKAVCSRCNEGWMSELETEAGPVLGQLIAGQALDLSLNQSDAIGRWAVKTAMMFEFNHRPTVAFTEAQRRSFFVQGSIPTDVNVSLAAFRDIEPLRIAHSGGISSHHLTFAKLGTMGVTAVVLGRMALFVASASSEQLLVALEARMGLNAMVWKPLFHEGSTRETSFRPDPLFAKPVVHVDVDRLLMLV